MDDATINIWFWCWITVVPLIVFSVRPSESARIRSGRLAIAVLVCWILMVFATDLKWDLRVEELMAHPNPTEAEMQAATADGANLVFTGFFGWIAAAMYVGLWEIPWRLRYRRALARGGGTTFSNALIGFATLALVLLAAAFLWSVLSR